MSDAASVIDGYELLNCISTGNVSQVWEVKQVAGGQTQAMKLLLPEAFADSEEKKVLKQEANVGKSFEHPNLVTVYEVKISRKHAYFTMELFRGNNLKALLRTELPAVQQRAKKMFEFTAQALQHMHERGWVHKDVKPANILATKGGDVRVIDFSLATRAAGALTKMLSSKKSTVIQGTRTYIAPELVRREPTTPSVDIYSFGVTLYEILTGRPPFVMRNPNDLLMAHIRERAELPSGYNSNVTPEADQFVMKMLAKKSKDRQANMQEVFAELRSIQLFKEDPVQFAERTRAAAADTFKDSMAHRLDSRTDAERTPEERAAHEAAEKERRKLVQKKHAAAQRESARQAAASAQQPQTQQGGPPPMMPGAFPTAPGYGPPPGYAPMPGYFPGYPMQGTPMPPGAPPPGMPPYPGPPPQQAPPQQAPPQQAAPPQPSGSPPQQPAPGQPAPAQPSSGQPAESGPPESPVRKKTAPKREDLDELPLMDELPDVM